MMNNATRLKRSDRFAGTNWAHPIHTDRLRLRNDFPAHPVFSLTFYLTFIYARLTRIFRVTALAPNFMAVSNVTPSNCN